MEMVEVRGDEDYYDFYKCNGCGRLITALEEKLAATDGIVCRSCGVPGTKFSPVNMSWYHWFLPRVMVFAYLRLRGRA